MKFWLEFSLRTFDHGWKFQYEGSPDFVVPVEIDDAKIQSKTDGVWKTMDQMFLTADPWGRAHYWEEIIKNHRPGTKFSGLEVIKIDNLDMWQMTRALGLGTGGFEVLCNMLLPFPNQNEQRYLDTFFESGSWGIKGKVGYICDILNYAGAFPETPTKAGFVNVEEVKAELLIIASKGLVEFRILVAEWQSNETSMRLIKVHTWIRIFLASIRESEKGKTLTHMLKLTLGHVGELDIIKIMEELGISFSDMPLDRDEAYELQQISELFSKSELMSERQLGELRDLFKLGARQEGPETSKLMNFIVQLKKYHEFERRSNNLFVLVRPFGELIKKNAGNIDFINSVFWPVIQVNIHLDVAFLDEIRDQLKREYAPRRYIDGNVTFKFSFPEAKRGDLIVNSLDKVRPRAPRGLPGDLPFEWVNDRKDELITTREVDFGILMGNSGFTDRVNIAAIPTTWSSDLRLFAKKLDSSIKRFVWNVWLENATRRTVIKLYTQDRSGWGPKDYWGATVTRLAGELHQKSFLRGDGVYRFEYVGPYQTGRYQPRGKIFILPSETTRTVNMVLVKYLIPKSLPAVVGDFIEMDLSTSMHGQPIPLEVVKQSLENRIGSFLDQFPLGF